MYECADCKITLDDHYFPEPSAYQKKKAKATGQSIARKDFIQGNVPVDQPSDEELLFLSCGGPPDGFDTGDLPQ